MVVGVDGSDISRKALRWAVTEAQLRHLPLEVVHVWQMIYPVEPMTGVGAIQFSPNSSPPKPRASSTPPSPRPCRPARASNCARS
ncbi:MAG: universal stress protein [Ilumatobacteraceae bacterium]